MSTRADPRSWSELATTLHRLNTILVPKTKRERDRWQSSPTARAVRRVVFAFERFTDDGQVMLVVTSMATAFAVDVRRSDVYMAWATLAGVLFASWLWSWRMTPRAVALEVTVPRRVTVGEEATFTVSARNGGARAEETLVARGPMLSWEGTWSGRRAAMARIEPGATSRVELRARFFSRGEHRLGPFRLHAMVPFGLSLSPAIESAPVRLLAVPKVAHVGALSLPHGRRHQPGGVPRASRTADSRELLGVRPYRFGDPIRDLHARTWARVGEPVVREYREEFFTRVGIVLDTELGAASEADFEAAVSLVAGVVARLERTEAIIDVMVLGTAAHELTLGRSLGTLDLALELLACVDHGGAFDGDAVLARALPRASSLSCLVLVTLHWDAARRAFAEAVEGTGTACVAYVVSERERAPDSAARAVSPSRIRRGEVVAL